MTEFCHYGAKEHHMNDLHDKPDEKIDYLKDISHLFIKIIKQITHIKYFFPR